MPETIHSSRPFRGRIVSIRVDDVRLEDGVVTRQEVVEHAPSVTMIPVRPDGRIVLIRQYRHPTGEVLLETPAGSIDPGETPEQAAARELAEEIGFHPRQVVRVGGFYLAPGWATEFMHVFVAQELVPATAEPDTDERIQVVPLSLAEIADLVRTGQIRDCKTLAALTLARDALRAAGAIPDA
jgi:ADP-ribose pyrophosphatase